MHENDWSSILEFISMFDITSLQNILDNKTQSLIFYSVSIASSPATWSYNLARHSWAQLRHKIENSRAQLGHSRGTAGAQLGKKGYLEHSWGTVKLKAVGVQLGHNLRTDERKVSLGTVEAHLGHTYLLGTVGAGLRLR